MYTQDRGRHGILSAGILSAYLVDGQNSDFYVEMLRKKKLYFLLEFCPPSFWFDKNKDKKKCKLVLLIMCVSDV
jgi:hypothetical protein